MPYLNIAQSNRIATVPSTLYKTDHPRWIDYHIDFFGEGTPSRLIALAVCGEALLGLPA